MLPDSFYEEVEIDGFVVRRLRPEIVQELVKRGWTSVPGYETVPGMTHESDTVH